MGPTSRISSLRYRRQQISIKKKRSSVFQKTIGRRSRAKRSISIRGRDLINGLPKTIAITNNEVTEAISDRLREVVRAVKKAEKATEAAEKAKEKAEDMKKNRDGVDSDTLAAAEKEAEERQSGQKP